MKLKVVFLGIVMFFVATSCNNKKEYYDNGNISKKYELINGKIDGVYKEYYLNENLKKVSYYSNGVLKDSLVNYYDNEQNSISSIEYFVDTYQIKKVFYKEDGFKDKEGHIFKNKIRVGNWYFYRNNKVISQKLEYLNIAGVEYVNQGWYYDKQGKELENSGNYIKIETKNDTVKINEPLIFLISLVKPYFSYDSDVYVCLPKNKLSDLKQDFSNLNQIPLDTFISVKDEKIVKDSHKYNRQVSFGLTFVKEKEIVVRGFLTERYPNNGNFGVDKKYEILERKIYFEKKIYVKK